MCNEIDRAVETYDHLLWDSLIRICGLAFSKSFARKENSVRVVYQTHDPEFPGVVSPVDPREAFQQIKTETNRLIALALPIRKLGIENRRFNVARSLCSHHCYLDFLLFGCGILTEADRLSILFMGNTQIPVFCDFVEIGDKGSNGYICCPCVGEHLDLTSDLLRFEINLKKPKRGGKDTYEFRFEISAK